MPEPESRSPHAHTSLQLVRNRAARICVVGLGYVGLPTAVAFARAGFRVVGADISPAKVDAVNAGISPLTDLGLEDDVRATVAGGKFSASADVVSACREADAVLLIVPTPVDDTKRPDLSFVRSAAESAARGLRPGQLVVLESTTYPGTTEEIVVEATERLSGLQAGKDFGVAYCPERYNPGDPAHRLDNVHRVVGAIDPAWTEVSAELYGSLNGGRITRVRDLKTAEAAKVIENIQRDLNIALVNELALIFERLDIDVNEVLDAAATKWNFVRYQPGPGVGGHCLPVDPYYLTSLAERHGYHPRVILAGRAVNDSMPGHVVDLVAEALNDARKPVKGTRIAVLGLSYKADTGDARESPAAHVVHALAARAADLRLCDPLIPSKEIERLFGRPGVDLKTALHEAEAVVLLTDHAPFRQLSLADMASLAARGCCLIDTRNVHEPQIAARNGFVYRGIGRRRPQ